MAEEIEQIPGGDIVTRLVDFPRMYDKEKSLILDDPFQFTYSKDKRQYLGESLNWAKYAVPPDDVHRLGCAREVKKRETNAHMRYTGYIAAVTQDIRNAKNKNGHGFKVEHVPSEGRHHAEISYVPNQNALATPMDKLDRAELKVLLRSIFSELNGHKCEA